MSKLLDDVIGHSGGLKGVGAADEEGVARDTGEASVHPNFVASAQKIFLGQSLDLAISFVSKEVSIRGNAGVDSEVGL